MLDFQQKRKVKNVLYHRYTLAVLLVLVLFSIHSTWSVYQKKRESESLKATAESHFADLQKRNTEIDQKISDLGTDEGLESEIRAKFSVAKDGENMVVVVDDEDSGSTTPKKDSWWSLFIKHFTK